jgi:hypothetical protein
MFGKGILLLRELPSSALAVLKQWLVLERNDPRPNTKAAIAALRRPVKPVGENAAWMSSALDEFHNNGRKILEPMRRRSSTPYIPKSKFATVIFQPRL